MICNHNWSAETHEGVPSRFCHVCNEWEIEVDYDRALAEVDRLKAEVDRLKAERDKLISERRQLRARLVECRPWVGVCPYPNTPKFDELMAIRALVDDTLEEVK